MPADVLTQGSQITGQDQARAVLWAYVDYMRTHPWDSGDAWERAIEFRRQLAAAYDQRPIDTWTINGIGLAADKGGMGLVAWWGCPDERVYRRVIEAGSWVYLHELGEVAEGRPLTEAQLEGSLNYYAFERRQAIERFHRSDG